jgi:putative ABC transport system permease protein
MDSVLQDLRYAVRQLRAHPGFTLVAVLTLALGIGANSTLFTIINAVLLRPLPYPESERIASVSRVVNGVDQGQVVHPEFLAWEGETRSFEALAAHAPTSATLTGAGEPEELRGAHVSANFFHVLRVQPTLGRLFTPDEQAPGAAEAVLLSHSLWTGRFGAAPGVLGRTITLSGKSAVVVGVLPPGFSFPGDPQYWVPLRPPPVGGAIFYWWAIGRLRPGISLAQASTELAGIQRGVQAGLPWFIDQAERRATVNVITLHERLYGDARPVLLMLLGAVAFVLLIACANVANLLLARAEARRREFAIRTALGAGRWRIVRQLLVESVLLALLGGGLGLLVPIWALDLFVAVSPASVGRVEGIAVDGAVLAFTLAVALVTGMLFGLAPAFAVSPAGPHEALKEGGLRVGDAAGRGRLRRALVVVELTAALVLLIGAGLLLRSFERLTSVDPGFRSDRLLAMDIHLPGSRYRDDAARNRFFQELVERVRGMPGVEAAGLGDALPLRGFHHMAKVGDGPRVAISSVDSEYLRTLGITLRAGRSFGPADQADATPVAIVNATLARALFPGLEPIGRKLDLGGQRVTIVGVAQDVVQRGLDVPTEPQLYRPLRQTSHSPTVLVVRSMSEPAALVEPIRRAVRAIDPEQLFSRVHTMDRVLADSVAPRWFNALLLGLFAGVALLLAAVGLYGVMAHLVTQRTHEIGVRIALGARHSDVMRLVVRQAMGLIGIGTVLGLGLSLGLTRVVRTLLYQVSPTDPLTFASVPVLLAAVAGLACWLPARRATRVDPMVALRAE